MGYTEVKTIGPVKWARLFESNRDMEGYQGAYIKCDGAYTVSQVLTKEEVDKLKKAGSKKKRVEDGEGDMVLKHIRKHHVVNSKGETIEKAGGPPLVVDKDGKKWDETIKIGNGSVCEITSLISTFSFTNDAGQKEATARQTILKVKVLELVEYTPEGDDDIDEDIPEEEVVDAALSDDVPF